MRGVARCWACGRPGRFTLLTTINVKMCTPCRVRLVDKYANTHNDPNGKRTGGDHVASAKQVTDAKVHARAGDTVHMLTDGTWEWVPPKAA